jgi:hypothetical protein
VVRNVAKGGFLYGPAMAGVRKKRSFLVRYAPWMPSSTFAISTASRRTLHSRSAASRARGPETAGRCSPLTVYGLLDRMAVYAGRDPHCGKFNPRRCACDFTQKLSPYCPCEIRTIPNRDHESARSADHATFIVRSKGLTFEGIFGYGNRQPVCLGRRQRHR